MSDNFNTLSNRLLNRCPAVGIVLAGQLISDSYRSLQAYKDWSWRKATGCFAPPTAYNAGLASTNVSTGNPTLITGSGTVWTADMVGTQIRIGGLLFPYYDIVGYISPTQLVIGQPWNGPDVSGQAYQILQCYFPVPQDFGYFDWCVSVKDGFKLWCNATQNELALWDPQRSSQGQTFVAAFRDFSQNYGGIVGPVIPVTSPTDPAPTSTTTFGYSYPTNASYIVQVVSGGITGTATWQWMRAGQTAFQPTQTSSDQPQDLGDGVQVFWPDGVSYVTADLFVINCQSLTPQGVPRYELWPAPTFSAYLYPFQYTRKELDISAQNPTLPPPVASRGELLLEMALEKCATFPGSDSDHPNIYYSLQLADYHRRKYQDLMIDFETNDQNIAISNIDYDSWPYAGGVWETGAWRQDHAVTYY